MQNNSFEFIEDKTLKRNLQITLSHIMDLVAIAEDYGELEQNSFTKTAVIYIATLIEALLLWKLKEKLKGKEEIELKRKWLYKNPKVVYKISENPIKEVVCCIRQKEVRKLNKLDFHLINQLALDYKIVSNQLFNHIDKVRQLRNKLHIGSLRIIDKGYTKKELVFATSVLEEVIRTIRK